MPHLSPREIEWLEEEIKSKDRKRRDTAKKTVEYYMPVINSEFRKLQALSLLIFDAMTEASILGFKCWNWGGTWETQKGVYSFKKKWGTHDKNYYYLTKVNNEEIYKVDEEILLREYSNFYVLPFKSLLKNE